jgi:hypothetical protein
MTPGNRLLKYYSLSGTVLILAKACCFREMREAYLSHNKTFLHLRRSFLFILVTSYIKKE